MSPFFGHGSLFVVEPHLWQQINPIATNHCSPIESVRFVQDFFGRLWASIHLCRCAEQRIYFFNVVILARLVIGNDDGGMPFLLAEWKHQNVPLPEGF